MKYEANSLGKVKDLGEVFQVAAPLDKQILAFQEAGIAAPYLATPEDIAQIRLFGLSTNYSRTSIAPIAVKGEKTILVKDSPLMNHLLAVVAVDAHINGKYPSFSREIYEQAKAIAEAESGKEPEDRIALVLSKSGDYDLTHEMDEARFSLGKHTQTYFKKFNHSKIPLWNLSTDGKEAVVNYLWFYDPLNESNLYARDRYLNCDDGAFGVLKETAEGSSQNSYSPTQVRDATSMVVSEVLKAKGVPALEKMLAKPLAQGIVDSLRSR
jgi:hypothetical protein